MKQLFTFYFVLALISTINAQSFSSCIHDAFLITRMAQKFHLKPKAIDNEFSNSLILEYLNNLDEDKIVFQKADILKLLEFRYDLDDEINKRSTRFLDTLIKVYKARLQENDSLIRLICSRPFAFTIKDKVVLSDTLYATDIKQKQERIAKVIKWQILDAITDDTSFLYLTREMQLKVIDSLEALERKNISRREEIRYRKLVTNKVLSSFMANLFCSTISNCYDPHTQFMRSEEKDAFEEDLGKLPLRFGFSITQNEDKSTIIDNLVPGSPAYKSGTLNSGDRILNIQVDGKPRVQVTDLSIIQIDSIFSSIKEEGIQITVKKPDGTTRIIPLIKEQFITEEEEEDKVQSYVLKGVNKVGLITIPDFYFDWNSAESNISGCANEVAKEILKLKKENIKGLILDLRYNGGGSVLEAIELTGLFIDGGPIGQYKDRYGKIYTLKDVNSGTIYDGPLVVIINNYSASASEFFCGALQDYNRALIVGAPSFGKATGQNIYPLDTLVTEENASNVKADKYLKLTNMALYRITGATAQFNGVEPDILLPDLLSLVSEREKDSRYAILPDTIKRNRFFNPLYAIDKRELKAFASSIIDTAEYFRQLKAYQQDLKQDNPHNTVSLMFEDMVRLKKMEQQRINYFEKYSQSSAFTVEKDLLGTERLRVSPWLTEIDNESRRSILFDPYINISYGLVLKLIK